MVTIEKNNRYLVHLTFSATLKSAPNILQNNKSLIIRVLEITEGLAEPPITIRCRYQTSQYGKGKNVLNPIQAEVGRRHEVNPQAFLLDDCAKTV